MNSAEEKTENIAEELTEEEKLLLPQTNDYLNIEKEYRRFLFLPALLFCLFAMP